MHANPSEPSSLVYSIMDAYYYGLSRPLSHLIRTSSTTAIEVFSNAAET